jgi:hypothetical protein
MKNHIVVAVYNENLDWIDKIDVTLFDIFIYNKGSSAITTNQICKIISLENIGRESHTYLHHIIENYDNLPEHVLFFQGRPDDHVSQDFIKQINTYDNNNLIHNFSEHELTIKYDILTNKLKEEGLLQQGTRYTHIFWVNHHALDCPFVEVMRKIYSEFIEITEIDVEFVPGANFGVCRRNIINKPKTFYLNCIEILRNSSNLINPNEGHAFERLWKYIFANSKF